MILMLLANIILLHIDIVNIIIMMNLDIFLDINLSIKIFIQINIGSEEQKSGIDVNKIE